MRLAPRSVRSRPTPRRVIPHALLLALVQSACQSQGGLPAAPPVVPVPLLTHGAFQAPVDVEHYSLDIVLQPAQRSFEGSCTVRMVSAGGELERVALQLAGLTVSRVVDQEGRECAWQHSGEELQVELAQTVLEGELFELTVSYGGQPAKGLWFAGGDGGVPTHCFTQGEPEDSHWWFPCIDRPDDRATSEVRVSLPPGWVSVAAGERVEQETHEDGTIDRWRMASPHPPYLLTLVAGDFVVIEDEWDGVPLSYLVPPDLVGLAEPAFAETGSVLEYFSDITGVRYPYPKYSQACVENFPFGGMENISATTLTTAGLDDELGRRDGDMLGLLAHEAAHQWFGDLLTSASWSEIWLNEGFATYLTLLYFEHSRGLDEYRDRARDMLEGYLRAAQEDPYRATVWDVYREPIDLFDEHVYAGGALRLHQLRAVLGDESFFDGLAAYCAENAGRSVTSSDLLSSFERSSGEELDWFFEQWIDRPGVPDLKVSWSYSAPRGEVRIEVLQRQARRDGGPPAFRAPVQIQVRDALGTSTHTVWIDGRRQTIKLPSSSRPVWVRFDVGGWLPKRLESIKEPAEWLAISSGDSDVTGRRDAVRALGSLAVSRGAPAGLFLPELVSRLQNDSSRWVRAEAASALGAASTGSEARRALLAAARDDASAQVRTQALESLQAFLPFPGLDSIAREIYEESYSYDTMTAAAALYCAAAPEQALGFLQESLETRSPHDQLRAGLLGLLGTVDDPGVPSLLRHWALDVETHPSARRAAVRSLGRLEDASSADQEVFVELLSHENFRLRLAALEALASQGGGQAEEALERHYQSTPFARERRIIEAAFDPRVVTN